MCPDSEINDMQGVRMLQNSIANVPNLANVLIMYRQTKTSAGLSDKITLRQFVALLSQQAQVYDNGRIRSGRNCRRSAANHELDYEVNAHNVDEGEERIQMVRGECNKSARSQDRPLPWKQEWQQEYRIQEDPEQPAPSKSNARYSF